jgi:TP901 family phage tail tape measure protein
MTDFATLVMRAKTKELGDAERDLDRLGNAAERTEDRVDRSGAGMERSSERSAGSLVRSAGKIVAAYVSVQAAMQAVNMARGFNAALAETSTLISGTPEEMAKLEEGARSLAMAYGTDATEQVKAYYQAISAGAGSVAEATALLDQANKLALGGVTDVTTGVDALTTAVNAYKADGLSAAEASDAMFVAMRAGKTTIGELSGSLGQIVPIASAAGVSFDEVTAGIAALTTQGLSTSMATTGLRQVIASVIAPTKQASDMAKQLGIEFDVQALKAKGLQEFLEDVIDATGGNKAAMAQLFGPVEALGAVLAFAGGAGETFASIMDDMGAKVGATDAAAEKMADSLNQRWNVAAAKARDLALSFGQALLTVIVPAVETAVAALAFLGEHADSIGFALGVLAVTQFSASVMASVAALYAGATAAGAFAVALNAIPFVAIASAAIAFVEIVNASREAANVTNIYAAASNELKTALDGVNLATAEGARLGRDLAAAHLEQANAAIVAAKAELERWQAMTKTVEMASDLEGSSFISGQIEEANRELERANARLQGLSDAARDLGLHLSGMAPPIRDADTFLGALLATADNLSETLRSATGIDLSPIFANAEGPANKLLGIVQTLLDKARAAGAALAAAAGQGPERPGMNTGTPLFEQGMYDSLLGLDIMPPTPETSSGGGGGASEAEKEAEAINKVVEALKAEIALVGESEEVRRLDQELRKAGVDIHSEEGQAISDLVEQLTQLEAKEKAVADTMQGIENAAQGFFTGVLSGAKDLESAISNVLQQLGQLFLNNAFQMLWGGGGGIGGGGLGGFLGGLFGRATGGPAQAGMPYMVNEKTPNSELFVPSQSGAVLNVPQAQAALRDAARPVIQPNVNVTATPQVVVLNDPRRIDEWMRTPEYEASHARVNGRLQGA